MFGLFHWLTSPFAAIVLGAVEGRNYLKEKLEPKPPEGCLSNMELFQQDVLNGVSSEERMRNMQNGKYVQREVYPEPHRDENGEIMIENSILFEHDKKIYGVAEAYKRARRGAYNLSPEELIKEKERIQKKYDKLYKLVGCEKDYLDK